MKNKLYYFLIAILVFTFMVGFHNVDLCRNEQKLQCMFNEISENKIEITENSLLYNISLDKCYAYGLFYMVISFIIIVYLSIIYKK